MNILTIFFTILGLAVFEIISSIDNAIINAEVLTTMGPKSRRWFLIRGIFIAVFLIRGLLPWLIVWATNSSLGPIGALTATFSSDPSIAHSIEASAPVLLIGGGIFLIFLFFHWLFLEPKNYLRKIESAITNSKISYYIILIITLLSLIVYSYKYQPISLIRSLLTGTGIFFLTSIFKSYAEKQETSLMHNQYSDISKILYLELIDATFSIDGVIGAFAFTLSVPIILLGNGLGAYTVRQITVSNINRIKKYKYLKNGAMYSIFFLGLIMILESIHIELPDIIAPAITIGIVGWTFYLSIQENKLNL